MSGNLRKTLDFYFKICYNRLKEHDKLHIFEHERKQIYERFNSDST